MDPDPIEDPVELFHAHLDGCMQCRENPFNLCPVGTELFEKATANSCDALRVIDLMPNNKK